MAQWILVAIAAYVVLRDSSMCPTYGGPRLYGTRQAAGILPPMTIPPPLAPSVYGPIQAPTGPATVNADTYYLPQGQVDQVPALGYIQLSKLAYQGDIEQLRQLRSDFQV